jgi:hypothetical protein
MDGNASLFETLEWKTFPFRGFHRHLRFAIFNLVDFFGKLKKKFNVIFITLLFTDTVFYWFLKTVFQFSSVSSISLQEIIQFNRKESQKNFKAGVKYFILPLSRTATRRMRFSNNFPNTTG